MVACVAAALLPGAHAARVAVLRAGNIGPVVVTETEPRPSAEFAPTRVVDQFKYISRDYDAKFDATRAPAPRPSVWLMAPRGQATDYGAEPRVADPYVPRVWTPGGEPPSGAAPEPSRWVQFPNPAGGAA